MNYEMKSDELWIILQSMEFYGNDILVLEFYNDNIMEYLANSLHA